MSTINLDHAENIYKLIHEEHCEPSQVGRIYRMSLKKVEDHLELYDMYKSEISDGLYDDTRELSHFVSLDEYYDMEYSNGLG